MVAGAVDAHRDSEMEEATSRQAGPSLGGSPGEAHVEKDADKHDNLEHDDVLDWEVGATAPRSEPASGPHGGQPSPKPDPLWANDPWTRDGGSRGAGAPAG